MPSATSSYSCGARREEESLSMAEKYMLYMDRIKNQFGYTKTS